MKEIVLQNINFGYAAGFQIRDLSLHVRAGSFTGIVGPNGSGKSTVLSLMSGVVKPANGSVLIGNRPLASYSRREIARQLAVVSAERTFEFPFKVRDVVALGRFPHAPGRLMDADWDLVSDAMERAGVLPLSDRPITQLSSGERQLVLIARALAQTPQLMLLDEPDAHLDIHHQLQVLRLLKRVQEEQGITLVLVTHDLSAAASFCSSIALMSKGRLLRHGPPDTVLTDGLLRDVYGEDILVTRNPVDGRPLILLTPGRR